MKRHLLLPFCLLLLTTPIIKSMGKEEEDPEPALEIVELRTRILYTMGTDNPAGLKAYLERGGAPNATLPGHSMPILSAAAAGGHLKCMKVLLAHKETRVDEPCPEHPLYPGASPLIIAIAYHQTRAVALLLRYGANPTFCSKKTTLLIKKRDFTPLPLTPLNVAKIRYKNGPKKRMLLVLLGEDGPAKKRLTAQLLGEKSEKKGLLRRSLEFLSGKKE